MKNPNSRRPWDAATLLVVLIFGAWIVSLFHAPILTDRQDGPLARIAYLFQLPVRGFVRHAEVIGFVFACGAALRVFDACGSVTFLFSWINRRAKGRLLPSLCILVLLLSLAGATIGLSEELVAICALVTPWLRGLGISRLGVAAVLLVATQVGFAAAFANPFNLGIAAQLAKIDSTVDVRYRLICWVALTTEALFLLWYFFGRRALGRAALVISTAAPPHDWRRAVACLVLVATTAMATFGICCRGWDINHLAAALLFASFLTALVVPRKLRDLNASAVRLHILGAQDLFGTATVLALAGSLSLMIADFGWAARLAQKVAGGPTVLQFLGQTVLKLLVPSASSQASLTIPAITNGITENHLRDVCVLTYQLADGLALMLSPSSGVVLGVLATLTVSYRKWLWLVARIYCPLAATSLVLIWLF